MNASNEGSDKLMVSLKPCQGPNGPAFEVVSIKNDKGIAQQGAEDCEFFRNAYLGNSDWLALNMGYCGVPPTEQNLKAALEKCIVSGIC